MLNQITTDFNTKVFVQRNITSKDFYIEETSLNEIIREVAGLYYDDVICVSNNNVFHVYYKKNNCSKHYVCKNKEEAEKATLQLLLEHVVHEEEGWNYVFLSYKEAMDSYKKLLTESDFIFSNSRFLDMMCRWINNPSHFGVAFYDDELKWIYPKMDRNAISTEDLKEYILTTLPELASEGVVANARNDYRNLHQFGTDGIDNEYYNLGSGIRVAFFN